MHDINDTLSRIAHHQLAIALVFGGVITNLADVWITLQATAVESNPVVLALGWEPWVVVKAVAVVGLVGTWVIARGHRLSTPVAAGPLAVGLFGLVGNASASGWLATDLGTAALAASAVAVVGVVLAVVDVRSTLTRVPQLPTPSRRVTMAVGLALLVALSPILPWLGPPLASLSFSDQASAAEGDLIWSSGLGGNMQSSPTIANGAVYIGLNNGSLYAANATTGEKKWVYTTGDSIYYSSPTVANGTVYVASSDNDIYAIDAETGQKKWNASTGDRAMNSPTVANGTVYVGSEDSKLYAFDAETGTEEWNYATGGSITSSSPSVVNGTVYVGSEGNSLHAIDADTGSGEWTFATGSYIEGSPTVANDTVYIGSADNSLYAVDAGTGSQEWSYSTGGTIDSSPTVKNGKVFFGSKDGSVYALDAATGAEEWTYGTGFNVISSPTVANGTVYIGSESTDLYALDAETGNKEWSYGTGDGILGSPTVANGTVYIGSGDGNLYALDTSHSKDSSGSRNDLHTLGHAGGVYQVESTEGTTDQTVNGTVENQNGQPVSNATVVGWGVDYSNISASKAQSLEDRANEIVQESSSVRPKSFDPELQLTGSNGKLADASEPYVAVHTAGDWNLRGVDTGGFTPTVGPDPQLGNPLVRAPAGRPVVLSVWNPRANALVQDGVDGDLPGRTIEENKTIVIEQIGPANSTINEPLRVETKPYVKVTSATNLGTKTHHAAKVELPTGFYRVSAENSSVSYVMAVGDTKAMVQSIQSDLNATATTYSNRAKEIREKVDQGKLTKYRTTTNANGSFSFSTGSNVKTVGIQAYKKPPGMSTSPENVTMRDIQTYYATTDYNGSVVLPSNVETVDAPSSNNTVHVREYSAPNYPELGAFRNKTELFNQWLQNLTYSELPSQFQQNPEDVTRQQWKASYETLRTLIEGRPALEERAQELLGSNEELFIDASGATTAELRQRATVMQQAFVETPNTVDTGDTSTSTTTDTISARFPFDTDLSPEDVMVTVQYPNGTSEVLNTSSEYVTVENNLGADAVAIENYPTNSDGPGSVTFDIKVANSDGVATARERVDNPAVSGTPPSIAGISLTTLHPGPDESVSMTLDGGETTTITNVTQATVYGPDGTKVDTTITGNRAIEFRTAGQGIHTMQVTFETSDGKTATVTERITAGTNPRAMPAGVRVSESPLGVYAVTGDGIDAGEVSIENGGSAVTILAQLNETADVPSTLHIYTSGLSLPPESDLTVRVVKGAEQQSVSKNVIVSLHLAKLNTEVATIYANGNPLPRDGGSANGEVSTSAGGTTVQTLTDANGVLELSTDASPGRLDRIFYRLELETGIDLPALVVVPSLPSGLPGWEPPASAGLVVIGVPLAVHRSSR